MKVTEQDNGVLLEGCTDFDVRDTFDCGQCFRFHRQEDGSFQGIAFGKLAVFSQQGDKIWIKNIKAAEFEQDWRRFLDLDRDYGAIKKALAHDAVLAEAITHGPGIRILKQEFFECLISFILSQQNNIPKIKRAVEGMALQFGEERECDGQRYHLFPTSEQLRDLQAEDFSCLKIGYRAGYVADAVKKVCEGLVNPDEIARMTYEQARGALMQINGVGQKVADCVLLFSFGRFDAFPVDTWIKKAMLALYGVKDGEIPAYTASQFGAYSGFAQQYIFHFARQRKL